MRRLMLISAIVLASALGGCLVAPVAYQPAPAPAAPPPEQYDPEADQVSEPPPPIPVYEQPACPVAGYIWTPGLWEWGPAGYFWVPGTWIEPPAVGLLWTPGYWGLAGAVYVFHRGYWGPQVGFYGGINYGYGYVGSGYAGGRWVNNEFHYNTAVTNVNVTVVHNTYNQTIVNNINVTNVTNVTHVSYAGGPGTRTQPNAAEVAAAGEAHVPPTSAQVQHTTTARANPQLAATQNAGHPPIAATANAREFSGAGVTAAKPVGPAYHPQTPPTARTTPGTPFVHARDVPQAEPVTSPSTSASAEEQAYARQQSELHARQEQERQTLSQQQEREHASFAAQPTHDHQAYETMERQHQQQTSQMVKRQQHEREQSARSAPAQRSAPHESPR